MSFDVTPPEGPKPIPDRPAAPIPPETSEAPPPAPVPTAPADQSTVVIHQRGRRYVLGEVDSDYALWDAIAQGAPLRRWPLTPEGWGLAWGEYSRLEGTPAAAAPVNAWAIVAACVGAFAAVFWFAPALTYPIPLASGVVAIILGFVGKERPGGGRGAAFVGIGLGILGVVAGVIGFARVQEAFSNLRDAFSIL
jgi:hypothetical protein